MDSIEKSTKIQEVRNVISNIRKQNLNFPQLNDFLNNISICADEFEQDNVDELKTLLCVYDIQGFADSPIKLQTPIHPNYLSIESNDFEQQFKVIINFFEYIRTYIQKN